MTEATAGRAPARTPSGLVALVAAVAALGVSIYLTIEHYDKHLTLSCPDNGTINCQKVTTSSYSVIAGVPVAVLGLAFYVVMVALLAWPARNTVLDTLRVVGATAGILMVFWLVYVELFQVNAICLWCTGVHVLTLIVFGSVLALYFSSTSSD